MKWRISKVSRPIKFTNSQDNIERADVVITFRLGRDDLVRVLTNAIRLGFCEDNEYLTPPQIWKVIKSTLKDAGSNALICDHEISDWARTCVESL